MLYREQNAQRALSPTSITIADYVINPYAGCDFDCAYCYAKLNSTYKKKKVRFGEDFVEIKPNFIELLAKEIKEKKPQHVLIGSTTEVYQHIEQKKKTTRRILELLNEHHISYSILTKSHYIERDIDLISQQAKNQVYVTLNTLDDMVRIQLEKQSSSIPQRLCTIEKIHNAGIRTIIHVGPYLPDLSDGIAIIDRCKDVADLIEFENLNLKMAEKTTFLPLLKQHHPTAHEKLATIYETAAGYTRYYTEEEERLTTHAHLSHTDIRFFFYPFESFYTNILSY
ncbi:radical SAM protein [Candidatus Omnitrophota bacterium]